MRTQWLYLLAAGVSMSALAGMVSCSKPEAEPADGARQEVPAAHVALVRRGDIVHTLSLAGQFEPYQVVDVHPKVSGFMREIKVDIGDRVSKGETLAVLEVPELHAQLQSTTFDMAQAQADITRAQHEIARAKALHEAEHLNYQRLLDTSKAQPGLVAQQELDDAQSKDLQSESQVDAAKAAADAAQQHAAAAGANNERNQALEDYTHVIAPIAGVVTWRYADTGALIQSGTNSNQQDLPIVRLAQSSLLRLRMPVPEEDVRYVHEGDTVQVRVDALNRSITGKIVRFTRDVNFETRTMETEVDVQNPDLSIAPGMYANARMETASARGVLTMPVEAVVLHGSQTVAYVVDAGGRVRVRTISVGVRANELAEVRSGLEQGDRVITGGQSAYADGEQVSAEVKDTPASDEEQDSGGVIDLKAGDEKGGAR